MDDDLAKPFKRAPSYIGWWNGTAAELMSKILRHPASVVHFGAPWDSRSRLVTYASSLAREELRTSHPHIKFFKYDCNHPAGIIPFCQRMGVRVYPELHYICPNMTDDELFSLVSTGTDIQSLPRVSYLAPTSSWNADSKINVVSFLTTPAEWKHTRPFNSDAAVHDEL